MDEGEGRRSRRQLLFGGVAAAAGALLGRAVGPEAASAANGDPVVAGQVNNATTSTQVLTNFGVGVLGRTTSHAFSGVAGIVGAGVNFPSPPNVDAGVYGRGGGSETAAGVWGEAPDGVGVVGSGSWGVYGSGGVAVAGDAAPDGTGVYGFVGATDAPLPSAGVAVEARAAGTSLLALNVAGKASFSRSGRIQFDPGTVVRTIALPGVTRASMVFAVPQTHQNGVYVTAAAPFTNLFVVRLSKAPTIRYWVAYLVLD